MIDELDPAFADGFLLANLREKTTGLPFIVWVSQVGWARHSARVKVSRGVKANPSMETSYRLSPFGWVEGPRLSKGEEDQLREWVEKNYDALVEYWAGDLYTEDLLEKLKKVGA